MTEISSIDNPFETWPNRGRCRPASGVDFKSIRHWISKLQACFAPFRRGGALRKRQQRRCLGLLTPQRPRCHQNRCDGLPRDSIRAGRLGLGWGESWCTCSTLRSFFSAKYLPSKRHLGSGEPASYPRFHHSLPRDLVLSICSLL